MKEQPKKQVLGILGLGSRSTLFYIDELNKRYNQNHTEFSTCPFLLYNTDFSLLNPFLPNDFQKLVPQLTTYIHELTDLGISHLLIPNITLHETFDLISSDLLIIHPVDLAIQQLKNMNVEQVVVFGSKYTMTSDYLKNKFSKEGIRLISPTVEERVLIDEMRKQVYNEEETQEELIQYHKLLKSYASSLVVLVACTELSIVNKFHNERVVDMAISQIDKAVDLFRGN